MSQIVRQAVWLTVYEGDIFRSFNKLRQLYTDCITSTSIAHVLFLSNSERQALYNLCTHKVALRIKTYFYVFDDIYILFSYCHNL